MDKRRNIVLLAICQALYLASMSVNVSWSGMVGYSLAPTPLLATLPYALITVATATVTIPISFLMARIGRRGGFMLGAAAGLTSGLVCAYAILQANFVIFCLGNACYGVYQACAQYYRFAAADAARPEKRAQAVSWVLAGGLVSAFIGPTIASVTRDYFAPVEFAGSYIAVVGLSITSMALLAFLDIPLPAKREAGKGGRPLWEIVRQPAFITAVTNSVAGYAVMAFLMTASPLAAIACGHSKDDATDILRFHVVGMFAPAFFTGPLIARFGVGPILSLGGVLLIASVLTALGGTSLLHFKISLMLLGVGWNFCYIGGTTLLATTYRPEERAKAQATNEFMTFGTVAVAALSSGGFLNYFGWEGVNWAALPLLCLVVGATLWYALSNFRSGRAIPVQ